MSQITQPTVSKH